MEDPEVPALLPATTEEAPPSQALRHQLEELSAELQEANEERAQAAEYGLVVLEEKQALQAQHEELIGLYDATRREMDNAVATLKQVQADYEKRLKDVEYQREQLLDEMESRETSLVNKNSKLDEEVRAVERKLKQTLSEHDHLNEHNSFLTGEVDRLRREAESVKEENCRLKQETGLVGKENSKLRKDVLRLEKRVTQLLKCEEDCSALQELNRTLRNESQLLQELVEGARVEKEDLEHQNRETIQALNEEREAKGILESKFREDQGTSPGHPSWALENERASPSLDLSKLNHVGRTGQALSSTPIGGCGGGTNNSPFTGEHSAPFSPPKPSLLSELQTSFMSSVDHAELEGLKSELDALRLRCKEVDDSETLLQKEKLALEDKVTSLSVEQAQTKNRLKDEFAKMVAERERVMEGLKEDLLARDETIGSLRNKMSSTSAEKASMGIEIDGLNDELQRIKQLNGDEIDKLQKEVAEEQLNNTELNSQIAVMEEQVVLFSNTIERLENIISNSHYELTSMTDDLRNLHKTVVTLGVDGKVGATRKLSRPITPLSDVSIDEASENGSIVDEAAYGVYYSLQLQHGKKSVQVHNESHSLHSIIQLHDQLKSVRLPLERFTKSMLERSLAHSAKKQIGSDPSSPNPTSPRRHSFHFETQINKMKANLSHKNEEISNLRAIMKARSTTADVATSSLRSKLEGQARAYQTELTRLKHQIRTLKKDRDEHLSLRTMYAKRCEDYIEELTRLKKAHEQVVFERGELMTSLQKTIQRKLDLSWELEEYKMEQERKTHIPKKLGSSRV